MRVLFCGDVVGKSGRRAIDQHLPFLKKKLKIDLAIVNGENAASGFGFTHAICEGFLKAGANVITGGDHVFDKSEIFSFIGNYPSFLRPANFPEKTPGKGFSVFETPTGAKVLVIHVLGQVFMKYQLDSPFSTVDAILKNYKLGGNVKAIIVDIHAEATSEKMGLAQYLDGRVSLVVGSHTHIPTADAQIFTQGTAFQCDAGMCGDYDSVIGFDPKVPLQGFIDKYRSDRMEPANGDPTLCGTFVEIDDMTGLAKKISPVRIGGRLQQHMPEVA
ncbi:MAG: TIGR00282 family metallophosphoesterase [Proteobacteria bacterium]|nr:TIGR00282 family metallophosphoesterase [Pseudomonadota bacterium]